MKREPSGIKTLDEMIDGGFPRPSCIGIIGDVGSGKTILSQQIAWNSLNRGFNVLYYAVDEPADDVKASMKLFDWDVTTYEKEGKILFIDVFTRGMALIAEKTATGRIEDITVEPDKVADVSYNFREMITAGKKYYFEAIAGKDLLVVFDSLSPLFSATETSKVLRFLQYMRYASRVGNAIGIATLQLGVHGPQIENAAQHLADGVIELRRISEGGSVKRLLRVVKMVRTKIYEEYCPMEITDKGISVHKIPVAFRQSE